MIPLSFMVSTQLLGEENPHQWHVNEIEKAAPENFLESAKQMNQEKKFVARRKITEFMREWEQAYSDKGFTISGLMESSSCGVSPAKWIIKKMLKAGQLEELKSNRKGVHIYRKVLQ